MKARVKATGQIVRVLQTSNGDYEEFVTHDLYCPDELVFDVTDKDAIYNKGWQDGGLDPDYWTRLEHQYAGMAMQGMIRTVGHDRMYPPEKIAIYAIACATALVEKLKNE